VVASQVYHWEVILKEIIRLRAQDQLGGESFVINLANGGQVMVFNERIDIPADVMAGCHGHNPGHHRRFDHDRTTLVVDKLVPNTISEVLNGLPKSKFIIEENLYDRY
jgi:hypothetical protein